MLAYSSPSLTQRIFCTYNLQRKKLCSVLRICIATHIISLWLTLSGHWRDGVHREAWLAECDDLRHCHLQVLWDVTHLQAWTPRLPTRTCPARAVIATLDNLRATSANATCKDFWDPEFYILSAIASLHPIFSMCTLQCSTNSWLGMLMWLLSLIEFVRLGCG